MSANGDNQIYNNRMSLNLDFVAIITQFSIDVVILVGLVIYLLCTHSWNDNSKQDEEAADHFNQMR